VNVLVTGCGGMLGSAVLPAFRRAGYVVFATDLVPRVGIGFLDVRDHDAVRRMTSSVIPRFILHLAAETDLERCEDDRHHAFLTNAVGTQNVALVADEFDIPVVYISTAGVFDGLKHDPYDEFDRPNPINVYGASKYAGEEAVARLRRHFIVRAGWMIGGGERDHKFVAKVRAQLDAGAGIIRAVDDKWGTPTYTKDFAANLLALIETPFYGLYHMTCHGKATRYDVAQEIVSCLGSDATVVRETSDHFRFEYFAPRPRSEAMRNYMLAVRGLDRMRPWQEALRDYLSSSSEGT
jgi:dTDP-4-dehydrorhamnose reductase